MSPTSRLRSSRSRSVLSLCVLFLAACASPPTSYVPAPNVVTLPSVDAAPPDEPAYGYDDGDLKDGLIRVSFRGNASTPPLWALDFALLRAAEVSLARGFPYFVVRERLDSTRHNVSTTTTGGTPFTTCDKKGRCTTTYTPSSTSSHTYVFPSLEYIVEMLSEAPADETVFALDAAFVQRSVRRKHGLGAAP